MAYDAHGLANKIKEALKDTRFTDLLTATGARDTDYAVAFQQAPNDKDWPRMIIDIVSAEPVVDVGQAVEADYFQYEVYIRVEQSWGSQSAQPKLVGGSLVEDAHRLVSRYIRAAQLFFSTKLTPEDGFTLFDISTVQSGSFDNAEGENVARSTLQLALIA